MTTLEKMRITRCSASVKDNIDSRESVRLPRSHPRVRGCVCVCVCVLAGTAPTHQAKRTHSVIMNNFCPKKLKTLFTQQLRQCPEKFETFKQTTNYHYINTYHFSRISLQFFLLRKDKEGLFEVLNDRSFHLCRLPRTFLLQTREHF